MAGPVDKGNPDRRSQIINSALNLMYDHGFAGATTARIAAGVGVSEPALYRHFKNKQEILLAALDEVSARLIRHTVSAAGSEEDEIERLRLMSAAYYDFVMSHPNETRVLFDALSAAGNDEMRNGLRSKFSQLLGMVEIVLRQGVDKGAFRQDVDVPLVAWEIVSLGITLYFASILDFKDVLTRDKALTAVERLLASITSNKPERRTTR